jgi:catechol 2,3-dioxygenase-like lactoylglutathione lyase family enzyme
MAPIDRLDHVIIAVRDLEAAAGAWRKLGLTLTPRGLHEGKGTGNHCIMFPDSYVELLGIVDETGAQGRLADKVRTRGEGGMGLAWGADDADRAHAALRAAGVDAEAPNDLARPLQLDGTQHMVRFRNVMLPSLDLQGTMQFVCTHATPELTRARREWMLHPSGATGITEVMIAVDDIKLAQKAIAHASPSNTRLSLATRAALEEQLGNKTLAAAPRDGILALALRVNELDAAGAMLSMGRIPHEEYRDRIIVPADATNGIAVVFTEQDARD